MLHIYYCRVSTLTTMTRDKYKQNIRNSDLFTPSCKLEQHGGLNVQFSGSVVQPFTTLINTTRNSQNRYNQHFHNLFNSSVLLSYCPPLLPHTVSMCQGWEQINVKISENQGGPGACPPGNFFQMTIKIYAIWRNLAHIKDKDKSLKLAVLLL